MFRSSKFLSIATALTLCSARVFSATEVSVPAAKAWIDSGINVSSGQRLHIRATGQWSNGGANPQWVGADGWSDVHVTGTLAPQAPLSALIGRIGSQTFLIGSNYRASVSEQGSLFLSINDTQADFNDNQGAIRASVSVLPPSSQLGQRVSDTEYSFTPAADVLRLAQLGLIGGEVQLSQTGEGVEKTFQANGASRTTRSFLVLGPALGDTVLPIDLPVKEHSIDQLLDQDTGGVSVLGQYVVTHSAVFVDNVRLLVNNVHADFDEDLRVRLADGEVLLDLTLHSGTPTLRGEGNGYSSIPFGVPYPLGWQDGLCPDLTVSNMTVTIHLAPSLDAAGRLHLQGPKVELAGDLSLSVGDVFLKSKKEEIRRQVEAELQAQLQLEPTRTAIEQVLTTLLLQGRPNANVTGVKIDENGIEVAFRKAT